MNKAPRGFVPYCKDYHCAGDCGLPGDGYQHSGHVFNFGDHLMEEMRDAARKAVFENVRHSHDSLFSLIGEWFPEATDEEVRRVVEGVL